MSTVDRNFLLIYYRNMPDIDFIGEWRGGLRIRVSKLDNSKLKEIPKNVVIGMADNCFFLFENIGRYLKSLQELRAPIEWYKDFYGLSHMKAFILEQKPKEFFKLIDAYSNSKEQENP